MIVATRVTPFLSEKQDPMCDMVYDEPATLKEALEHISRKSDVEVFHAEAGVIRLRIQTGSRSWHMIEIEG